MGYVVRMPQLGMSMDEGTVLEWRVEQGTEVEEGATVAVVESEKTQADVEAREDGVLRRVIVDEGTTVEPGDPIGVLAGSEEDLDQYLADVEIPEVAGGSETSATQESSSRSTGRADDGASSGAGGSADDVRATPGASRLADENDVSLAGIEGTGPQGVVTEEDVRSASQSSSSGDSGSTSVKATPGARQRAEETGIDLAAVEGTGPQGVVTEEDVSAHGTTSGGESEGTEQTIVESRPLSGRQQTIGDRLGESYRNAVHVTLNRSFDTTALRETLDTADDAGVSCSLTDLLLAAVSEALTTHPEFNAVFEDGEHRLVEEVNIGVAIDLEDGLVTPVIPRADRKSIEEINEVRRDLTDRVQSGEFTMDDLEGGTFTVSNLGMFGVDDFDPIINPPEIAILGVGRTRDDGTMTLSLSFDHRIVNGADAARFLDGIVTNATDRQTLRESFDADLQSTSGGREEEEREVRVEVPSGFAGTYRVAGSEVAFDEPTNIGGTGTAPTPVEHLLGALGACLSAALREMASRDDVELDVIACDVDGEPDHGALSSVDITFELATEADDEAVERALTKAERSCFVERALSDDISVAVSWTRQE